MAIDTTKVNSLIQVLTVGVEKLYADLSGADKKAMVQNLLADGATLAEAIDPKDGGLIATVESLVSVSIDAIVSVFKNLNIFKKKTAA